MAIRGILFDKDGTLVDFAATWLPVLRRAAEAAAQGDAGLARRLLSAGGYDLAEGRVAAGSPLAAGTSAEIARLWAEAGAPGGVAALTARLDRIFTEEGAAGAVPVCDLPALFGRLRRRGLALGVATSDSTAAARATLERLALTDGVDFVAGYDSGHGAKPGPGMVRAFCTATGLSPAETAVVGDNLHDLEMGRAAGARLLVGVLTGTGSRAELAAAADAVIASVAELEALLRRLEFT